MSSKRPYRRKLSNYLLDKSLQLRYVVTVVLLSALIAGALGYLIWRQEADASAYVLEAFDAFTRDRELRDAISSRLSSGEWALRYPTGSRRRRAPRSNAWPTPCRAKGCRPTRCATRPAD